MSLLRASFDGDTARNSKRKLDECLASCNKAFWDSFRMSEVVRNVGDFDDCGEGRVLRSRQEEQSPWRWKGSPGWMQFFVRLINGKTILVRASCWDSVAEMTKEVERRSGIPVKEQRVVYAGRQLYDDSVLNDCGITDDSLLQMVARLRSTPSAALWQEVEDINHFMRRFLCSKEHDYRQLQTLNIWIGGMLANISTDEPRDVQKHVTVLVDSNFPAQLMKVYLSVESKNQHYVSACINLIFAASLRKSKPYNVYFYPLILQFGKMLSTVGYDNHLYLCCRKALAQLVYDHCASIEVMSSLPDILPFVSQTAEKISADLVLQSRDADPSLDDIRDFGWFFELLKHVIKEHFGSRGCIPTPIPNAGNAHDHALQVTTFLYTVYLDLLAKISSGLQIMEIAPSRKEGPIFRKAWRLYLPILKVLYSISKLYVGAEENYRTILGSRKTALSSLILTYSSRTDNPTWILELKDLLDFKAKRHLVLLLFPDVQYDYDEMNELLIDRSNLLAESFEYMKHADRKTLHSTLFVEFKNEEATGPGVLREWFIMVCQAIFYGGNPLFTACPNDRRRFYLNPASTVDPLHPDYLRFCGRVIALALRHRVQVGIVFDRVFFLQLAGMPITLEDIKEADPEFYRSCKHILDMDAEFVDTDALGLTFVREVEEMGSRKVFELCRGGKNKVVNSHNRGMYVELLVLNRFVVSTSQQLLYFFEGFGDILADPSQGNASSKF